MALIAIGVTFGSPDSSAQIPTTSSDVGGSLSTASTDAATLATQGTTVAAQGTTCATAATSMSSQGTIATNDLAAMTTYASNALGSESTYFPTETCTVGGTLTVGDILSIIFTGTFTGSPVTVSYTTLTGDTPTTMAAGLAAAINANATLTGNAYAVASASAGVVYIGVDGAASITYTVHNSGTTETLTLGTLAYINGLGGVAAMSKIKALGSTATTGLSLLIGDVSTVGGDITTIQGEIGTLQADIAAVQAAIAAAETIISGMALFIQTDTTLINSAATLSSGLQSALAFALAQGIVGP